MMIKSYKFDFDRRRPSLQFPKKHVVEIYAVGGSAPFEGEANRNTISIRMNRSKLPWHRIHETKMLEIVA